jgi:hypothetical protein
MILLCNHERKVETLSVDCQGSRESEFTMIVSCFSFIFPKLRIWFLWEKWFAQVLKSVYERIAVSMLI